MNNLQQSKAKIDYFLRSNKKHIKYFVSKEKNSENFPYRRIKTIFRLRPKIPSNPFKT